jgi:hypothetical protein
LQESGKWQQIDKYPHHDQAVEKKGIPLSHQIFHIALPAVLKSQFLRTRAGRGGGGLPDVCVHRKVQIEIILWLAFFM